MIGLIRQKVKIMPWAPKITYYGIILHTLNFNVAKGQDGDSYSNYNMLKRHIELTSFFILQKTRIFSFILHILKLFGFSSVVFWIF